MAYRDRLFKATRKGTLSSPYQTFYTMCLCIYIINADIFDGAMSLVQMPVNDAVIPQHSLTLTGPFKINQKKIYIYIIKNQNLQKKAWSWCKLDSDC